MIEAELYMDVMSILKETELNMWDPCSYLCLQVKGLEACMQKNNFSMENALLSCLCTEQSIESELFEEAVATLFKAVCIYIFIYINSTKFAICLVFPL